MYVAVRHDMRDWFPMSDEFGDWLVQDRRRRIELEYTDEVVESIVESLAEMGFAVLDAGRVVMLGV